ncbi:MAG: CDP-alcohol phosphatidyltransferase family protein [Candidatus Krumholzibacteriia bacterium]
MIQNRDTMTRGTFTVPNLLTAIRLVLAVAAATLFIVGRLSSLAVSFCLVGVVLDALDGWYARRFAQCTNLGRFMDPLADKMLMLVVYGVIVVNMKSIVIWALFALVAGRDVVVTSSRLRSFRSRGASMPSDRFGKAKMIIQSIGGAAILVYAYILNGGFTFLHYPVLMTLAVVMVLSYISAGRYLLPGGFMLLPGSKRGE